MATNTVVAANINPTTNTTAVVPVVGFVIKKFQATQVSKKDEEDLGRIQITLEAETDDIRALDKELADVFGALNMHRVTREPVALQLRF